MYQIPHEVVAATVFPEQPGAPPLPTAIDAYLHNEYSNAYYSNSRISPVKLGSNLLLRIAGEGLFDGAVVGVGDTNTQDRTVDIFLYGSFLHLRGISGPHTCHFITDLLNLTRSLRRRLWLRGQLWKLAFWIVPRPATDLHPQRVNLAEGTRSQDAGLAGASQSADEKVRVYK